MQISILAIGITILSVKWSYDFRPTRQMYSFFSLQHAIHVTTLLFSFAELKPTYCNTIHSINFCRRIYAFLDKSCNFFVFLICEFSSLFFAQFCMLSTSLCYVRLQGIKYREYKQYVDMSLSEVLHGVDR